MGLDHEKLDAYRVSLDFAVWAYERSRALQGADRHARDQLLRDSQSIPLNIVEGCGKIPSAERGNQGREEGIVCVYANGYGNGYVYANGYGKDA